MGQEVASRRRPVVRIGRRLLRDGAALRTTARRGRRSYPQFWQRCRPVHAGQPPPVTGSAPQYGHKPWSSRHCGLSRLATQETAAATVASITARSTENHHVRRRDRRAAGWGAPRAGAVPAAISRARVVEDAAPSRRNTKVITPPVVLHPPVSTRGHWWGSYACRPHPAADNPHFRRAVVVV